MVRRAHAQHSVFAVLLPDGAKLWDDELLTIDALFDDDDLVDLVDEAWTGRAVAQITKSARSSARRSRSAAAS